MKTERNFCAIKRKTETTEAPKHIEQQKAKAENKIATEIVFMQPLFFTLLFYFALIIYGIYVYNSNQFKRKT